MTPPLPPPGRELKAVRRSVSGYFFVNGVAFSSWVARIPDIKHRTELGDGLLGAALLVAAAGTVLGLTAAGRFIDRLGANTISKVASTAVALGLAGPGLAPDLPALIVALLFFGLAGGAYNVSMNAQAVAVDRAYGRQIITSFHAVYSVGALVGSAMGAATVRLGIEPSVSLPLLAVALAAGAWACGRGSGSAVTPQPSGEPADRGGRTKAFSGRILLIGACCFACLLAEGAVADWSGVYLKEDVGLSGTFAPAGYMAFSVTMAAGRLVGDLLAVSIGAMRLVFWSALLSGAGLTAGLLSGRGAVALLGFGVFGAGLSCVMPQMFKAAGNQFPDGTGRAVAAVATLGYAGLLSGPPVIGLAAHVLGLPLALGLLVMLMLAVAVASRVIASWPPPPGPEAGRRAHGQGRPTR